MEKSYNLKIKRKNGCEVGIETGPAREQYNSKEEILAEFIAPYIWRWSGKEDSLPSWLERLDNLLELEIIDEKNKIQTIDLYSYGLEQIKARLLYYKLGMDNNRFHLDIKDFFNGRIKRTQFIIPVYQLPYSFIEEFSKYGLDIYGANPMRFQNAFIIADDIESVNYAYIIMSEHLVPKKEIIDVNEMFCEVESYLNSELQKHYVKKFIH